MGFQHSVGITFPFFSGYFTIVVGIISLKRWDMLGYVGPLQLARTLRTGAESRPRRRLTQQRQHRMGLYHGI